MMQIFTCLFTFSTENFWYRVTRIHCDSPCQPGPGAGRWGIPGDDTDECSYQLTELETARLKTKVRDQNQNYQQKTGRKKNLMPFLLNWFFEAHEHELTTSSLISPIIAVCDSITHSALVNALRAHSTMEVFLRTVVTVELIREVRTVHHSITHSPLLSWLSHLLHTPWNMRLSRYCGP